MIGDKENCHPRMTSVCDTKTLQEPTDAVGCEPWSVCLPFGGSISSDGGCIRVAEGTPPVDGTYGKIVIVDGCIVDVLPADIPLYTSSPCAPVPCPCGDEGGSLPDPSPTVGNMFTYDASGRPLVRLSAQAGPGITITGAGTAADPLIISGTSAGSTVQYFRSGNDAITLTGAGTAANPYTYTHVTRLSGSQGNYTFDDYGHLIEYNPSSGAGTINNILGGDGIQVSVEPSTGIATIALRDPVTVFTGVWRFGAYNVQLERNRIVNIERVVTAAAGTYRWGQYDVALDQYGDITGVVPVPPDDTLVDVSASKKFAATGETATERGFTMTTGRVGAFRISYTDNAIPTDMLLYVDGVLIGGDIITPVAPTGARGTRFEAITPATYAATTHTVQLQSASGFTSIGYLDIMISQVF